MTAHNRGRPILRALFLASAAALALGGALSATRALAQTESAAPAAVSDRMSVEVIGQGPDVILIPGYASSREVWRAEATRLAATHRVHMVQLAGFAGERWTHGDGAFLTPVVEAVGAYAATLDQPAIIGHSMGGLTALMVAQARPEAVGRIMLVDNLPFFSALYGPQVTAEAARPFAEQAAASILSSTDEAFGVGQSQTANGMSRDPATRAAMVDWSMASDRQALATAISEVMTTDARPGLAAMTTPVWALYASDADGGAPAAMAEALWSREYAPLPGVRLIRVDDSRHFIMADQPERFGELVDQFLAE